MSPVIVLGAVVTLLIIVARPRFGLYLMLAMAPLQNLLLLDNGSTLVRYAGIAVFASWLIQKMGTRASLRALFAKPVVAPMFVFLALCFISVLWTDFGLWQRDMFTYIQLGVWSLILIDLIDSYGYLDKALFWVFVGALIGAYLAITGFYTQTQQYNPRGRGGFDDPNYSSAIFMFVLSYVFYRVRYSNGLQRLAWLGSAVILLTGVAFTVSRTGLLAIALIFAGQFLKFSKTETRMKYIVLLIIFILITIPLWPWGNISYRFSIAWSGGSNNDLGQRMGGLRYGWRFFTQSPLIGNGLTTPPGRDPIHNVFLSMAVKLGIFGFLSMLWLWLVTFRSLSDAYARAVAQLQEQHADLISALQLSALIYLFFSLSLGTETSRPQWLLFALGSICWGLVQDRQTAQAEKSKQPVIARVPRPLSRKNNGYDQNG